MSYDDIANAQDERNRKIVAHLVHLNEEYEKTRNPLKKFWLALRISFWERPVLTISGPARRKQTR